MMCLIRVIAKKQFVPFSFIPDSIKVSAFFAVMASSQLSFATESDKSYEKHVNNSPEDPIIEEVIVSGKKSLDPTVIDEKTERLFSIAGAADDPIQAIYSFPGVTFSNDGEPVIRGSAPQDNAFYIDLIPAKYLFHVFGNSIINKNLVKSFDLYPAAFPSQFGNATGGVIDVALREPRNQDFTTTLNWSFLITGVMVESGLSENQSFYASYRRSLLDKFIDEDEEAEDGIKIDQFPISDDYQVKYRWYIDEQNSLSVVAAGAGDELAATFQEDSDQAGRDPDFAGPASYEQGFDSQGVIWDWQAEDGLKQLNTRLTHSKENLDLFYGADQTVSTRAQRYLLRSDYSQMFDQHKVTVGILQENSSYDYDLNAKIVSCSDFDPDCPTVNADYVQFKTDISVNTRSLYLQDSFPLTDSHWITLGVHLSSDDYLREKRIEPRLRWEYLFADNWTSYVAAGLYSQLPELETMLEEIGNPELTTIKAKHYVWGLEQQLDDGWSWKTDLYYKDLEDVVISISDPEDPDFDLNYTNQAKGRAYGIEFLLNKNITDKWYGWAALSLGKTERTNLRNGETDPFGYDKPVILNIVANYLLSDRWMLGVKWSLQSGALYTPIVDLVENANNPGIFEPVYGEYNSERYPFYHRLDIRAEYTSPKDWGYWKFYLDVLNAYGQENIEEYDYSPNSDDTLSPPPDGFGDNIPVTADSAIGFFPSIGFELQF